jgi:hypothetical protein
MISPTMKVIEIICIFLSHRNNISLYRLTSNEFDVTLCFECQNTNINESITKKISFFNILQVSSPEVGPSREKDVIASLNQSYICEISLHVIII